MTGLDYHLRCMTMVNATRVAERGRLRVDGAVQLLLVAVLVVGAPYWLVRMATSGRYRAGLGRLGRVPAQVPAALRAALLGGRWCGSMR